MGKYLLEKADSHKSFVLFTPVHFLFIIYGNKRKSEVKTHHTRLAFSFSFIISLWHNTSMHSSLSFVFALFVLFYATNAAKLVGSNGIYILGEVTYGKICLFININIQKFNFI